tara:strand:- start:7888 stop:8394 length:507 start_codon:yes stop_codon:yes gene_type:complete
MAKIKPNITITANSSSASVPGPLSIALSLAATPGNSSNNGCLLVDDVNSKMFAVPTANSPGTASVRVLDGSSLGGATLTAGTHGSFVYLRNTATADTADIYLGILDEQSPDNGTGPDLDAAGTGSTRTMTIRAGEFAFFPWDYTGDIFVQASTTGLTLECWVFDRSAS